MKRLLSFLIDKFQATFPPNRLMLILAGPITAASIWVSATVTANIPGVELPVGIVGGAIGAAALITITLIYKWFDQWQRGEPLQIHETEQTLAELLAEPAVRDALISVHPELFRELTGMEPPVAVSSSTPATE